MTEPKIMELFEKLEMQCLAVNVASAKQMMRNSAQVERTRLVVEKENFIHEAGESAHSQANALVGELVARLNAYAEELLNSPVNGYTSQVMALATSLSDLTLKIGAATLENLKGIKKLESDRVSLNSMLLDLEIDMQKQIQNNDEVTRLCAKAREMMAALSK